MSKWTDFRDSVEEDIEPAIAKGIAFLHTIETLAEAQALGDAEKAAEDAVAAAEATTGDEKTKIIAALEAFATELLGDAISIVKSAKSAV